MVKLPFLWKVEKGNTVSYLLGTAHLRGLSHLLEGAKPIIEGSKVLYDETTSGFTLQEAHMVFPGGGTINTVLAPAEVCRVTSFFQEQYQQFGISNIDERLHGLRRQKLWGITSAAASLVHVHRNMYIPNRK
jgi:uncharacterized protein YbaP (TraB family)